MDITLDKRYPIAASTEQAWQVLSDVRAVARCMPGAEITEQLDATRFKGVVKLKVGPVTAQFGGELEVLTLEASTRTVRLRGKGADKGGSTATLDLTAQLEPTGADAAMLIGNAQVVINGRMAQMAGRMIGPVAETVLAQFARNFSAEAAAVSLPALASPALLATEVPTVPVAAVTSAPAVPPPARELNALAVLWSALRSWFATLLGRRT